MSETMQCAEAVRQLWDYLDHAVSPQDHKKVEQHLSFCRTCCGELEFAKEIRGFLASNQVEEIPPAVQTRLVDLDPADRKARCSFCGKKRQRVAGMVEAPDRPPAGKFARPADVPRICNPCLTLCDEILSEALGVQPGPRTP